jgi:hypothetical protein
LKAFAPIPLLIEFNISVGDTKDEKWKEFLFAGWRREYKLRFPTFVDDNISSSHNNCEYHIYKLNLSDSVAFDQYSFDLPIFV